MKNILFIMLSFFLLTFSSDSLFDGVKFVKGKAFKNNIPVVFYAVVRTGDKANILASFEEQFKSHSSLHFYYNNKEYCLPISNQSVPDYLFNIEEKDTLLINIVIFDTLDDRAIEKSIKNYYSYVNRISKKE